MFRPVARTSLRHQFGSTSIRQNRASRNLFTSTQKKRSTFRTTLGRWVLAGGIVYYYATSNVFADQSKHYEERPVVDVHGEPDERPPSILDEVTKSARNSPLKYSAAEDDRLQTASGAGVTKRGPPKEEAGDEKGGDTNEQQTLVPSTRVEAENGAQELEDEAGQEGAFNPETGEINWDCPCLGGMADGPCGEDFKAAFSCFVYSEADPKGIDCIDKFKNMQTCFQKYPEIYGADLRDDEEQDSENVKSDQKSSEDLGAEKPEPTRSPETAAVNPADAEVKRED